jgi:hypothetical protein
MTVLQRLLIDRGQLTAVVDLDPTLPRNALALVFNDATTIIVVSERDDTIALCDSDDLSSLESLLAAEQYRELNQSVAQMRSPSGHVVDVSTESPWASVVSKTPTWAWCLTNNLGYRDGLQIEFVDDNRNGVTIQLVAAASQCSTRIVNQTG